MYVLRFPGDGQTLNANELAVMAKGTLKVPAPQLPVLRLAVKVHIPGYSCLGSLDCLGIA